MSAASKACQQLGNAAESKHQQIHAPQKTKSNLVQDVVKHVSR